MVSVTNSDRKSSEIVRHAATASGALSLVVATTSRFNSSPCLAIVRRTYRARSRRGRCRDAPGYSPVAGSRSIPPTSAHVADVSAITELGFERSSSRARWDFPAPAGPRMRVSRAIGLA